MTSCAPWPPSAVFQAHHEVCPKFPLTCDGCGKKKISREKVSGFPGPGLGECVLAPVVWGSDLAPRGKCRPVVRALGHLWATVLSRGGGSDPA